MKLKLFTGVVLFGMLGNLPGGSMNPLSDNAASITKRGEMATFGGGCFWCLEPLFEELNGVAKVEVGYAGGMVENPTYQQVCTGSTGHAEVIQVTFHPEIISFEELLKIFFTVHDPTTLNRQGADVGTQYRSIILYHNENQKTVADKVIRDIDKEKLWLDPVVTEVIPLKKFYKGEDYHQEYYNNNSDKGYCQLVINPKLKKFKQLYADKLKVLD